MQLIPNVYVLLKVLCILVLKVEGERCKNGCKSLKIYSRNALIDQNSSILALVSIHFDVNHDLDLMRDTLNFTQARASYS